MSKLTICYSLWKTLVYLRRMPLYVSLPLTLPLGLTVIQIPEIYKPTIAKFIIGTILAGALLLYFACSKYNLLSSHELAVSFIIVYLGSFIYEKLTKKSVVEARSKLFRTCRQKPVEDCLICLENFETLDCMYCRSCKKSFHQICLNQWLRESTICPHCRRQA